MSGSPISKKYSSALKRYKFDQRIRDEVSQYTLKNKPDNHHALFAIASDWIIITLFVVLSEYVRNHSNLPFMWPIVYFLAVCVIGARQRGLARGLHESTHRCFASNEYLNFVLGTFFSGYIIFQSFRGYETSHVKNHHPYLGTDRDPDYQGLKENGICGPNRTSANVKRYLRSLFLPTASLSYLLYLIKYRIWTNDDDNRETLVRGIYLTSIVTAFVWSGHGSLLLLYWIVPYFTAHMWIGSFIELMEHYPMIETAPRIDIFMTRNRFCGWLWNFFLGVHNESYHLVHHLFPKIPEWEYHNVHCILMEDPIYASLHEKLGWRNLIKEIIEVDQINDTDESMIPTYTHTEEDSGVTRAGHGSAAPNHHGRSPTYQPF